MLTTSGLVVLITCSALLTYEYFAFRQSSVSSLTMLSAVLASNCTAALAFDDKQDAHEILSAVKAERQIVASCIWDNDGEIFSTYPDHLPQESLPDATYPDGHRFKYGHLEVKQPIIQGTRRLGTLYLRSNMADMRERFRLYIFICSIVFGTSLLTAYFLSSIFQKDVSAPVLALAETARAISERKDYAVRAVKLGEDELGTLTDAFNNMLAQIQTQNQSINGQRMVLENIVESMGDAYVSLDEQWRYTFVNKKALTLMGKETGSLIGKTLWEIFPDTRGTIFEKEYYAVMTSRLPRTFETYYASYDMWLEVRVYPHEDGIAIFYTDITKYRKAEEEIRSFNYKLERTVAERTAALEIVNKELESFSYSVSHDLRAPLRSVHGYINIFSEEYANRLDDGAKRLIGIIQENAARMGQLIDDLLSFAKLGRKELSRTKMSMLDLVSGVWEELIRSEGHREIKFTLAELPMAYADSVTMKHVWSNLISNALKYTKHNNTTTIEIGVIDEYDDGFTTYYIKDNGAGFDMRYYDKLFGVFQRLHSQEEFEGTGVGLAIVHRIIVRHGGKIWAEGKPGKGATFFFSLSHNGDD